MANATNQHSRPGRAVQPALPEPAPRSIERRVFKVAVWGLPASVLMTVASMFGSGDVPLLRCTGWTFACFTTFALFSIWCAVKGGRPIPCKVGDRTIAVDRCRTPRTYWAVVLAMGVPAAAVWAGSVWLMVRAARVSEWFARP